MYPLDRVGVTDLVPGVGPSTLALGAVGLGIGASVAAWFEWATLRRSLNRSIGGIGAGTAILARMFAAALVAAAIGRFIAHATPDTNHILRAVLVLGPTGVIYLLATYFMGLPQSRQLVQRVIRR
jgi:putative peptidoglycan lipid II flippase